MTQSVTWLPSVSKGGTHSTRGILAGAHWWNETGWLLPQSEVEWKTNVMEGDRECLCLISLANVSDGSYLAPCSVAVYYPKVAGRCWEEKRTGSPFVIHHSGGLLPLLSDRYMDNCSSCLQTSAIWMSSRRRKWFFGSLYQSRWVIERMESTALFSSHFQTCAGIHTHKLTK